ncbi:pyruvate dehydrogenase [Spelaeicoccus albus]|uniref:Pyruvate dehydrogenase (Quinone) n=1 Tax=Spelaeicoccus albus TaxID=1280376 RepID=A0A7Z0AAF0_9MICO|nr:pyruvate dehydrogenase [Spelaeicoccus albus]NYI66571.1 pyruvate dehydrogenase (quinone) [Spelaeicoccus albus]
MAETVADQLVAQLSAAGVKRIYGIVGDSLNPVVDAVRRSGGSAKGGIDWVHTRHEEAAAFAAAAEAQLTGTVTACAGSCGPGNLHLINGLYDAQRSSAPVIAIAADIPSIEVGSNYFQETHPIRLFNECSWYNEHISTAQQAPRVVHHALQIAQGRSGVAVVTLPGDLAEKEAVGRAPQYTRPAAPSVTPDDETVKKFAELINKSKKVAIFAGIGVAGAHDEVLAFADKVGAPIGHSLRGKDFIQYDNPNDVGMTGLLGYGAAHAGIHDADLLILLGTDFPYEQFLPDDVTTVQVDIAAERLGWRTPIDLAVHGDVLSTLAALDPMVKDKRNKSYLKKMLKRHDELMTKSVGAYTKNVQDLVPIHPEYIASILDDLADDDAVFTMDTGMTTVWGARYINPTGRRRTLGSFTHGSMANALPQAIGAQLTDPNRQIVSMSGDGGLGMLMGELLTVGMYKLPVKILVFNNSTLGMVKAEMLVAGLPDFGVDVPGVDYSALGTALGMHSQRVEQPGDVEAALTAALEHDGPALVDFVTDPMALSVPTKITPDQIMGFAAGVSKLVLGGGAGEAMKMAKSNLRNIPRN